ncbi:MAG: hypothetical protein SPK26_06515 [Treponema sp.]|nr:hypothetical protein [Treponema sp.]
MKTALKWVKLIFLILLPLICVILINLIGDSANFFHLDISEKVAESILEGKPTYILGAPNGRLIKKALIEKMPDEVDTIVIGPSISMCINKEVAGTDSFYNLSVELGNYYDIFAFLGLLELNNKKYNRVILCTDFDFFNKGKAPPSITGIFEPYYDYMFSKIHNKTAIFVEGDFEKRLSNYAKESLIQLISIQYFQPSFKLLLKLLQDKGNRTGTVNEKNAFNHFYYMSDASWVYEGSYIARTEEFVKNDCHTYIWDPLCAPDEHLSEEVKQNFDLLMEYLIQKNVKVDIFISPLAPTLYDLFDFNIRPLLSEGENFVNSYAQEHNIRVIGSYSPYKYGLKDADFYDSRHLRREKFNVFNFSEE